MNRQIQDDPIYSQEMDEKTIEEKKKELEKTIEELDKRIEKIDTIRRILVDLLPAWAMVWLWILLILK